MNYLDNEEEFKGGDEMVDEEDLDLEESEEVEEPSEENLQSDDEMEFLDNEDEY